MLRVRHAVEAAAIGTAARMISMLPRRAVLAGGRMTGRIAYYLLAEDRRVAYANVDRVFGDAESAAERARIVRGGFANLGATMFGLFWSPRLTAANFRDWIVISPESEARLAAVRASGRGLILVTPHHGDWEMASHAIGFLGYPALLVAEGMRNAAIGDMIMRMRTLSGHTTIPPRFAVLKLFRHLSRGGSIGLLIDVNGRRGRGGVWLDFFGLPVFNSAAGEELALRADAALVFVYGRPLPGGRVELVVEPEVEPSRTGDRAADEGDEPALPRPRGRAHPRAP